MKTPTFLIDPVFKTSPNFHQVAFLQGVSGAGGRGEVWRKPWKDKAEYSRVLNISQQEIKGCRVEQGQGLNNNTWGLENAFCFSCTEIRSLNAMSV